MRNRSFYFILAIVAVVGGILSFFLPICLGLHTGGATNTDGGALRQSILYATGGVLALITLGESHRKTNLEQDKLNHDKEKSEQDHQREVHAARRERYTKAIEQLGHENAAIRLGGVYSLFRLGDEWIEEGKLEETQTIVDNLCAYIRSPFSLASSYDSYKKYTGDMPEGLSEVEQEKFISNKSLLQEEAEVRSGIIKKIHSLVEYSETETEIDKQGINIPHADSSRKYYKKSSWSDIEYNFSGSIFLPNQYQRILLE